ncbi:MAG: efflux transporter outer membrane subunit [Longimicrobiales bacterium]
MIRGRAPRSISEFAPALILVVAALTTGCKMGPDFEPPAPITPAEYRGDAPEGESIANLDWWDLYQDPVLQDLIRAGLTNNRSLRESMARINEARAGLGIVRADLFPQVNLVGIGMYQETLGSDSVSALDNLKVAAAASYEVDLWGRVARSNEAALQGLLATEEAFRTVTVALVGDIASAYLVLRDLDARIGIAEATLATRGRSLELLTARAEGGLIAELEVKRTEINVADTEAVMQRLVRGRSQTENVLRLLVGELPGEVQRGASLEDQVLPPTVPPGLPSDLLLRRPDVLAAERMLHAQTAKIGVAEAARFPSLSLTASTGAKSTSLGELVSSNVFLNLGANLIGPLFNAGKSKSFVEAERARTEQALNRYELVVLNAFREVSDALVGVETFRAEHEARLRQLASSREAEASVQALFDGGLVSYEEVLDLQRAVFGAELMVSEALQAHHTSIVQLYKVLGGGWSPTDELGS